VLDDVLIGEPTWQYKLSVSGSSAVIRDELSAARSAPHTTLAKGQDASGPRIALQLGLMATTGEIPRRAAGAGGTGRPAVGPVRDAR
jgi:hypothetical protein